MIASSIFSLYIEAGLSCIPILCDGSKKPAVQKWQQFQKEKPTQGNVSVWELANRNKDFGVAIIAGVVSGGLEVIDFDDGALLIPWWRKCPPGLVERLPIVATPSHGWHVFYRCEEVCGNHKIAMATDKSTLIETRGEGGYVVACGSPATCHPSGKPYVQEYGPVLPEIPTITLDERVSLWRAARTFDTRNIIKEEIEKRIRKLKQPSAPNEGDEPWTWFDANGDIADILIEDGWNSSNYVDWIRPGKDGQGISAKLNPASNGQSVLTVFSTNAGFELGSRTKAGKSFGAFDVLCTVKFSGDRKEATRHVRAMMPTMKGAKR